MQPSRKQLGFILLLVIIGAIFGIYKLFLVPKPQLIMKYPLLNSETNVVLKEKEYFPIMWNHEDYKGNVDIYFMDSTKKNVIQKLSEGTPNVPNEDNQLPLGVSQLTQVLNKKGYIKIESAVQTVYSAKAIIITTAESFINSQKKKNLSAMCSFNGERTFLTILTLDTTLSSGELPRGSIWLNNKLIGFTNTKISNSELKIVSKEVTNACSGKDIAGNDCSKNRPFIQCQTENVIIKCPGYNDLLFTPVRTFEPIDDNPNCNCITNLKLELMILDNRVRLYNRTIPISILMDSSVRVLEQQKSFNPIFFRRGLEKVQMQN
jgi:hypothetical protein